MQNFCRNINAKIKYSTFPWNTALLFTACSHVQTIPIFYFFSNSYLILPALFLQVSGAKYDEVEYELSRLAGTHRKHVRMR